MKAFAPAYSQEALAALIKARSTQRHQALAAIQQLVSFPRRQGDAAIIGPDGRVCQLLLVDEIVLTYWVDDAVAEIRIIAIEWPN